MTDKKIDELKEYVLQSVEYGDTKYLPIDVFEFILKDTEDKLLSNIEQLEISKDKDVTNIGLEFISYQKTRRKLKDIRKILDKLKQM